MNTTSKLVVSESPLKGGSQANHPIKSQFILTLRLLLEDVQLLLISDIFSYLFFIKPYCADTVAPGPKRSTPDHSTAFGSEAHHLGGALPFQKSDGMGHRIFRWYRNAKVNMIRHRMPFYDLYPLDSRPLLDRIHYNSSLVPIQLFSPIFGDPDDMVLTIPN